MAPRYSRSLSPAPSYTYSTSSNQGSLNKSLRKKASETQENSRIMDPSYLSGTPTRRLSGNNICYVDAEGRLHDVDYRPFPPISPSKSRLSDGEFPSPSTPPSRLAMRRSHKSSPQLSSSRVPYWETFVPSQPENSDEEDSADFFSSWPAHIPQGQTYACRSLSEHFNQYRSSPYVGVDEQAEKRVAMRYRNHVRDVFDDDEDESRGDDQEGLQTTAETKGGKERRRSSSPTESLQKKWARTKFGLRLNIIRTQRRAKEYLQKRLN